MGTCVWGALFSGACSACEWRPRSRRWLPAWTLMSPRPSCQAWHLLCRCPIPPLCERNGLQVGLRCGSELSLCFQLYCPLPSGIFHSAGPSWGSAE